MATATATHRASTVSWWALRQLAGRRRAWYCERRCGTQLEESADGDRREGDPGRGRRGRRVGLQRLGASLGPTMLQVVMLAGALTFVTAFAICLMGVLRADERA